MVHSMEELLTAACHGEPGRLAVAVAQDSYVLDAVVKAADAGIADPVLVGDAKKIAQILEELGADPTTYAIVEEPDKAEACQVAARMVRDGDADFIMKGIVDTAVVMRAILNRDNGLRLGGTISHDLVLEVPGFDRLFHVTDAAMTVSPTLEQKVDLVRNAVRVAHALGNACPKVAALCAVEKVNEKMPCTVEAAELARMNAEGEISGCIVDGPLQFDNAVSVEAAHHKGIDSPVAGVADILLVPDIEAGNMLVKAAEYFGHAKKAGVIVGAKAPVALTSRASSVESKLYTIALARLIARGLAA
ncbi:phosphate butyryltransferase [Collinsella sp. An271]|uniref:bifunctional enoyl-CoA hydratase/phosphate acetyltransferase n=1 Tax=Collinsella sp. An271 TaxID=1965616 RepID=UPI000B378A42|nr:bifunctional enoyl-CoA hydratase/phosphate acetyltransferase [Collinsella sp. An271]OUO59598.1 phosphate butyryltransferase [Collinsella sp. An271]